MNRCSSALHRAAPLFLAPILLAIGCGGGETRPGSDAGLPRTDGGPGVDGGPIGVPDGGRADAGSCVDEDDDGYGDGCASGADCDDTTAAISPAATETCNGIDDDCDDTTDEEVGAPSCALTEGVCAGAVARCAGGDEFAECEASDYGDEYEVDETRCDAADNDCDGTTDEGCTCTEGATQPCGSDQGECAMGVQTCTGGSWGDCDGETAPMGEVCDGDDNDCDGSSDEPAELTAPACPLSLGVCAGSTRTCGGASGWIACSGTASYGGDYQAAETLCDRLDNDCDGVTDEGCECVDGTTQACGSDLGVCTAGTQTCTAGAWGACAGEVAPGTESCDGDDEDCDGDTDEDVIAPACALAVGVCAAARQRCTGAGGFVACTATDYGATYQPTESRCDGLDNDCDGTTDEGCACVGGATQACGESTGACERGTQTCVAGAWGACTGGVGPTAEICNGLDDDCNGSSDDALVAPACSLSAGVCSGATQTCGGASGWRACEGTASYGPRYLATENGTDETVCDGLDNDCDGTEDEDCASGPLVSQPEDEVSPSIYHRHIAYLQNFDGNWDVVFANFDTGEARRLTATAENEHMPRVYGNHVAFLRGDDAAARAVLYALEDDTEIVLSTEQAAVVDLSGGLVVFDAFDGTQWDVLFHDIEAGTTGDVFVEGTTNELAPSIRGAMLAYLGEDAMGRLVTFVVDLTTGTVVEQTPAAITAAGHLDPVIDWLSVGWTDGRSISSATPTIEDDWDIYGAPLSADGALAVFPGENPVTTALAAQLLTDVDGSLFVWNDMSEGNWNPVVRGLTGDQLFLSHDPGTQAAPAISGNVVVWMDNRLGSYDVYASSLGGASAPEAGWLVINEILADPAATADVNGDGTPSTTQDELVEIVNATGVALDISGLTLSDAVSVRHTFPAGTVIPGLGSIVVFGGGAIGATSIFGGARVQIASSGGLALNNDGDTLSLRAGTTVIDTVTYGTIAGMDRSIVRQPEAAATGTFVRHDLATGSAARPYSPGTGVRGFAF